MAPVVRSVLFTCGLAGSLAAGAAPIVAVTSSTMLRFDSATPGTVTLTALTGIPAGETVVGIDRRPATKQVYLLTRTAAGAGQVYVLNTLTGVVQFVAALAPDPVDVSDPFTTLSGTRYGFDFNPVPDRMRIVSDTDTNLRASPNTGLVLTDGTLNPDTPNVVAAAYTSNRAGAPTTALFVIDSGTDAVYVQNPPNNGVLSFFGGLGVFATDTATFDIADDPAPDSAYATLQVGGITGLYSINLFNGQASPLGAIFGNPEILGMTVARADVLFGNGFE